MSGFILSRREIARRYIRGWFLIDIAATLPIDLLLPSSSSSSSSSSAPRLVKLLRFLKLLRVLRLSRAAREIFIWVNVNAALIRLLQLFLMLALWWHYIACFYWSIAQAEGLCPFGDFWDCEPHWAPSELEFAPPVKYERRHVASTGESASPGGVIGDILFPTSMPADAAAASGGDSDSGGLSRRYAHCFFWAISVTTGVGVNIHPYTTIQTVFSIFVVVVGVLMYALVIGAVGSTLSNLDHANAARRRKMQSINAYMSWAKIPTYLQCIVRDYYDYIYAVRGGGAALEMGGASGGGADGGQGGSMAMFKELPDTLQLRLSVAMNRELIQKIPIFAECETLCVIKLVQKLQSLIVLPGEWLVNEGEVGMEMFLIHKGSVRILLCRNESRSVDLVIDTLHDGGFFGENALLTANRRNASVRSLCHCDLMVLELEGLQQVMAEFPEFAGRMKIVSNKRNQETVLTSGKQKWRSVLNRLRMGGDLLDRVRSAAEGFIDPDEETCEGAGGNGEEVGEKGVLATWIRSGVDTAVGDVGDGGRPGENGTDVQDVAAKHACGLFGAGSGGGGSSVSGSVSGSAGSGSGGGGSSVGGSSGSAYQNNPPPYPQQLLPSCATQHGAIQHGAVHHGGPPAELAGAATGAVAGAATGVSDTEAPSPSLTISSSAAARRVAAMMSGGEDPEPLRPTMYFEKEGWNRKGNERWTLDSPLQRRSKRDPGATARATAQATKHWAI
jgi:CRP-like cAMP-binding protein